MSVDYEQRGLCGGVSRQQTHHGFRQWHLTWIGKIAGIDQKGFFGSDQQVGERSLKCGARIFPQDESLRVVRMHLQWRLGILGAIRCTFIPMNIHSAGYELRPAGQGRQQQSGSQQRRKSGPDRPPLHKAGNLSFGKCHILRLGHEQAATLSTRAGP